MFKSANSETRRYSFYLGAENPSQRVFQEGKGRSFGPSEIRVCDFQISYAAGKTWLGYYVGDESTCRGAPSAIRDLIDRTSAAAP